MNKAYEPKFNYILNDLALSNLITRNLYSKDVTYDDKRELENQIELIQQEDQQLKDNWNMLKEYIRKNIIYDDVGMKILDPSPLEDYMQELEQGSDSNGNN